MFEDIESRPNEQMVRISQNDLRIQFMELPRTDAFYRTLCSYGHERRRIDPAMRSR